MKTIEEAAKENALRNEGCLYEDKAEKHFKAGVEFAQRWIPVKEELPCDDKRYLVKGRTGIVYLSYFNPILKKWSSNCKVTHWRPIEFK